MTAASSSTLLSSYVRCYLCLQPGSDDEHEGTLTLTPGRSPQGGGIAGYSNFDHHGLLEGATVSSVSMAQAAHYWRRGTSPYTSAFPTPSWLTLTSQTISLTLEVSIPPARKDTTTSLTKALSLPKLVRASSPSPLKRFVRLSARPSPPPRQLPRGTTTNPPPTQTSPVTPPSHLTSALILNLDLRPPNVPPIPPSPAFSNHQSPRSLYPTPSRLHLDPSNTKTPTEMSSSPIFRPPTLSRRTTQESLPRALHLSGLAKLGHLHLVERSSATLTSRWTCARPSSSATRSTSA